MAPKRKIKNKLLEATRKIRNKITPKLGGKTSKQIIDEVREEE